MTHEETAKKVVKAIVRDISDRSGLGDEWGMIDDEIKKKIETKWEGIIFKYL